jgi:hypothetical protein
MRLRIKIANVSLRAFLYLLDQNNHKKELSNTTICDYVIDTFGETFTGRYKDLKSFRSGYAGNLSLIFDSGESQSGNLNKFTKVLEPILVKHLKALKTAQVYFDGDYCIINNIPDLPTFKILSVFFNIKPINALINRKVNLSNPEAGWLKLLLESFQKTIEDFPPNPALETGRGAIGTKAILNRYTIYNLGQNWYDVIKPNYFNYNNLRYKIFLHSLLIEQNNLYYCFIKSSNYDFDYNSIFDNGITIQNDEPCLMPDYINDLINLDDILIVKKDDIKDFILENVELPKSYQYMFTIIDNSLIFDDGTILDISPYIIDDYSNLLMTRSINPNITYYSDIERELQEKVIHGLSSTKNIEKRLKRLAVNGEESHTVMKFIDKSYKGQIKINDYHRDTNNKIVWGDEKVCIILYNGTKYPDLVCIFLEDAEKVERKGPRSFSEYSQYVWENFKRFKHLFFEVEAEHNLTSFKSHDKDLITVLQSKYIFCENKAEDYYISKFQIEVPAVGIKDI